MIVKLETGNGFGGALRYDVRAGKGTAKELARVLDADGVSYDYNDNDEILINPNQVGFDFRQQTMGYTGKGTIRKPVYHWVLSYHPDNKVFEECMVEDAKVFLKLIGFDDTQYVMTAHYDKKHIHLHIVTNVVNNQGKRIPTMGLIDKAHAAAAAITMKRGYVWGEKTKKENITADKMHKPHERARKIIEPMIREALAASTSLRDFQERLKMDYDIMCNYTVAKDGNRGRLSFCYEYEGQEHSFKASAVARDLSFGYVSKAIAANRKRQEKEIFNDLRTGYNAVIPPIVKELNSIRNNCYLLYKETADAGITVKAETTAKYRELKSLWQDFADLKEILNNEKDIVKMTEEIGGMLILLNPIVGLFVIFLAKITGDIRQSSQLEQKRQLLTKINSVRNEITDLSNKKAQLNIQRSERLNAYLDAKKCYQEYREGLSSLDSRISELQSDIANSEAPKQEPAPARRNISDIVSRYVESESAINLLNRVNAAFSSFSAHEHLVGGRLIETDTGMRWILYSDGDTDNKKIFNSRKPGPVLFGESYIDFQSNENGELVATIESDNTNYYSKGVSGRFNLYTEEGDVKERSYVGAKKEHDKKKENKQNKQVSKLKNNKNNGVKLP